MSDVSGGTVEGKLAAAGVSRQFWNKTLLSLGPGGQKLREYLRGSGVVGREFEDDRHVGRGAVVCGAPVTRIPIFGTFAKEMVLSNERVILTSLLAVVTALISDGDFMLKRYLEVPALFITGFYDPSAEDCPFTWRERADVQDFIKERAENCQRTYLSSLAPLSGARWWTGDWREEMNNSFRRFEV